MKVMHYHFGKDGGAERFFVHLVNAFASRDVEQTCIIRPDREWRKDIEGAAELVESNFRNFSLDRFMLPLRVERMAKKLKPNALMAWAPRASELMPAHSGCVKISRLGDYPKKLSYFKNTDVLVCNTPGIADHVRNLGWERGVEVISNFTSTEAIDPISRQIVETPEHATVVMTMGRFVKRKGFHTLIDAVSQLSNTYLWIAGEGEEQTALEQQVSALGLTYKVRFLGWKKDIRAYVAACDIFVMPSSHEPLGNVILEAWAQKRPVVSSRSEGPSWFMRDGENGLFAEIDDADSFASAISRITDNPELGRSLAEKGHQTLMQQFSEKVIVDAYMELFSRSA